MSQHRTHRTISRLADLALAAVAALCLGLLLAAPASASYQQIGCFAGSSPGLSESCKPVKEEEFGEEVQLGGVGGMAVNRTGAGGVPPGTVYAATHALDGTRVAMYEPAGEGLKFVERWEVTAFEEPYARCGPLLGVKKVGEEEIAEHPCAPRPNGGHGWVDVEVDQESGGVFVFGGFTPDAGENEVVEYEADGSAAIARFAKKAPEGKTVAETPGEVHVTSPELGPLAINSSGAGGVPKGTVYLADETPGTYHRLMVFEPGGGGYEYVGEVAAAAGGKTLWGPVTDDTGNLYLDGEESRIVEFAPEAPGAFPAPAATPLCTYGFPSGGIIGLTVDPVKGEPFFFSYKKPKRVRRLGACNPASHEFAEAAEPEALELKPERDDLWALAFDPARKLPGRPAGVLYGGAPNPEPGNGVGKGEPGQSALGYVFAHPQVFPPAIAAEGVSRVSATSAQLMASLDPKGNQTHYAFQYLSEAAYLQAGESFAGATEIPLGGAEEGGSGARAIGASLSGLEPETTYVYRAVATNHCNPEELAEACGAEGPVRSLRTYPEGPYPLPDGRAWELVSPAQKQGGQVLPAAPEISSCPPGCKPGASYTHFPLQSTLDGEAVAYEGTPFGGEGAAIENEYLSRRTASGWQTANPTPQPLFSKAGQGYKSLSADLRTAVLEQQNPSLSPEAPTGYLDLYAQPISEPGALTPLIREAPPTRSAEQFKLNFAGASEDGSRIFFSANDALTEEVPATAPAAPAVSASEFDLYEWHEGQLVLVNVLPGNETAAPGSFGTSSAQTISADGQRAFWSDAAGNLYVREGGTQTREVPGSGPGAKFLAAAKGGTRVLLSNGELYDVESEEGTDLTEGQGGFQGLVGQSESLFHLYFVDTAVLDEDPSQEGEEAEAGKFNLYAWAEGSGVRFVAQLVARDNGGGSENLARDWVAGPAQRTAEASPSGRYLAFLSQAPLTGFANTGPCESDPILGHVPAPCPEAFLYDAQAEALLCASCNRGGAAPLGLSTLPRIKGGSSQMHYLTDAGRLYFDSRDSLSPADSNEGAEDVYEFEPKGTGGCAEDGGCVALISAGREGEDSNFLAMNEGAPGTPAGADVFFTTRDRLVGADGDSLIDLYDAREGGGFAEEQPRDECLGEACQPPTAVPAEPTVASPGFSGPGNFVRPAKHACPKGKVRRGGRCVKKSAKKAKNHNRAGRREKGGSR